MANRVEVAIVGNADRFLHELKRAESASQRFGRAAGVAGGIIAGGLAVAMEKSSEAAVHAEAQTAALDQALKNAGITVKAFGGNLEKAESQGHKFGFSNNEVREALTKLVTATHDSKKAMYDLGVAEDLARFKHTTLQQASDTLTRAVAGSSRALKQLGIDVPAVTTHMDALRLSHMKTGTAAYFLAEAHAKAADKADTAAARMQALNEKLHGQAAAFSDTAAGAMARYHANLENLQETLGNALLPALSAVAGKLASVAEYFSEHETLAKGLVVGLGALAGVLLTVSVATKLYEAAQTLASVATRVWTAAQWALNAALDANPISLVIIGLVALGVALAVAWEKSKTFRRIVTEAWDAIKTGAQAVVNWFQGSFLPFFTTTIPNAFESVLGWLRQHWPEIAVLISGPFAPLVALATNAFGIRSELVGAFDAMKTKASSVIGDIVGFFKGMPGRIGAAITDGAQVIKNAVEDLFGKVIGWVKKVLGISSPSAVFHDIGQNVVKGFANGVGSMAGVLKDAVVGIAEKYVTRPVAAAAHAVGGLLHGGAATPSGNNQSLGQRMMLGMGWGAEQWPSLQALWTRESGWNNLARNPSSGAYGIPQALPPTKMPYAAQAAGGSDPAAQIGWGLNYIRGRYGSPSAAWAHELSYGWYDKGGYLPTGWSLALNTTGSPEPVGHGLVAGGNTYVLNNYFPNYVGSKQELTNLLRSELYRVQNRNTTLGFK